MDRLSGLLISGCRPCVPKFATVRLLWGRPLKGGREGGKKKEGKEERRKE